MCLGCYAERGFPKIISEKTIRAAALAARVYEFSGVGGNLHIVLDDWNLEDSNIEFCSKQISDGGYYDPKWGGERDSVEQLAAERECCDAFTGLTLDERAAALALFDKFLLPDGRLDPKIDEAEWLTDLEENPRD